MDGRAAGDITPPETLLASGPASPTESTSAAFTFSSSESNSTFECALDGSPVRRDARRPPPTAGWSPTTTRSRCGRSTRPATSTRRRRASRGRSRPPPPPAPAVEVSLDSGPASPTPEHDGPLHVLGEPAGRPVRVRARRRAASPPARHRSSSPACSRRPHLRRAGDRWRRQHRHRGVRLDDRGAATCPAPVTLVADADAWLDENSSTTNKGDDSILKVQSKAPRDNFRAVLHFPIPSLPSGCVVESATLSVYAASASPDRTLEVRRLAAAWSESTVTWGNQPETVGAAVTAGSGTGYRDWDVTVARSGMGTPAAPTTASCSATRKAATASSSSSTAARRGRRRRSS